MHEQQDMLCKESMACAGSAHLGHVGEEGAVAGQLGEEAREVGAHDQDALHILLAQEARLRSITGSVGSLAPAPAVTQPTQELTDQGICSQLMQQRAEEEEEQCAVGSQGSTECCTTRIAPCQSAEQAGGWPREKESRGFTLCHAAKRALSARCCWQRFMALLHLLSSSASSSTACHTTILSGRDTATLPSAMYCRICDVCSDLMTTLHEQYNQQHGSCTCSVKIICTLIIQESSSGEGSSA